MTKQEQSGGRVTLTPAGIPFSLRPCFQEYRLETLDLERDAFIIIERTLAFGNRYEVRWLFHYYGKARLREWVAQYGQRLLPRRRFRLWWYYFGLHETNDVRVRRGVWPY